jgi:hypothetical protein
MDPWRALLELPRSEEHLPSLDESHSANGRRHVHEQQIDLPYLIMLSQN